MERIASPISSLANPYYRTPAQASMDAMSVYQTSLPRVSSSLKPRADGRKKFTSEQTLQMEMLFRDNTHPSRDQRLQLAAAFEVGEKSIGIWFQNRRQAVRRERKLTESKSESSTTANATKATAGSSAGAASSRLTLERVASEHQLPTPKARSVFNASYHPDHVPHIWGHMMSSPSPPRVSPPRPHPYPRPRSNTNPSSDVESDSQFSTSTRDSSNVGDTTLTANQGGASSPLSRTRSVSPTRLTPRLAQSSLVRAHSDIGAQRTPRTTTTAKRNTGKTRAAAGSAAAGRVTLEWACANVKTYSSSPLRPADEQEQHEAARPTRGRKGSSAKLEDVAEDEDMKEEAGLSFGDGDEEEEDGVITETEADVDVDDHTEVSISEDMEAITPSEGRSLASVDIVSTSSSSGTAWSPRGSLSSSDTAVSARASGTGPGVGGTKMVSPMSMSRTRSHDREHDDPTAWLSHASGRTVRNPNARPVPLSQAQMKSASSSSSKSKGKSKSTASGGVTAPVPVPNTSTATTMMAGVSSSPNSPQEIEAALALCGLFASGRP